MRRLSGNWDSWVLWLLVLCIALAAGGIIGATVDACARAARSR